MELKLFLKLSKHHKTCVLLVSIISPITDGETEAHSCYKKWLAQGYKYVSDRAGNRI